MYSCFAVLRHVDRYPFLPCSAREILFVAAEYPDFLSCFLPDCRLRVRLVKGGSFAAAPEVKETARTLRMHRMYAPVEKETRKKCVLYV